MKRLNSIGVASALAAALFTGGTATADSLIYEGIDVGRGEIDGVALRGQTATVSIEFASGLTAFDSGSGIVFDLGVLTSATYSFSDAGDFSVDVTQDNLHFGSPLGFDLSFFDAINRDFRMLSGTTAGDAGLSPLVGETLGDMFNRLGDGSAIDFEQSGNFQMLNPQIGGLNGGQNFVTDNIVGNALSMVSLSYVPEPGTLATFGLLGLLVSRRRRTT